MGNFESYTYDSNMDMIKRTDRNGKNITYTYDGLHRMLTEKAEGAEKFTYNSLNQLIGYENINGNYNGKVGLNAEYKYMANGYRLSKNVNGIETRYLWDRDNIAAELNSVNVVSQKYCRGYNLICDDSSVYYAHDAHGDVIEKYNIDGSYSDDWYIYNAFGTNKYFNDTCTPNKWGYCDQLRDWETGNYYMRARYYNPNTGRFISEDTHWSPSNMIYGDREYKENERKYPDITASLQAANLYGYCMGNPVNCTDIYGLDAIFLVNENGVPVGSDGSGANLGHAAAVVQNKEGKWFYFSCGEGYIQFGEVSEEYMTDLKKFSNRYYKGGTYTTATYIKGDFTESYEYFKNYANTYGSGVFDSDNKARQGNTNYDKLTENCAVVATTGLGKGKLSDGTYVCTIVGIHAFPLKARDVYKNEFYNSCFTYEEYEKTIKTELSNTLVVTHPFKHSRLKTLL